MHTVVDSFPLPDIPLALCDIDGTLINASYSVTDSSIYKAINEAQEAGWTLGLSSDSAFETMERFRDAFGMNGPIIAEKGSVVETGGNLHYDRDHANMFTVALSGVKLRLKELGARLWEGDPVHAITGSLSVGNPGDTVVLINQFRRCSLGIFPRYIDESGQMTIAEELTDQIVTYIRPHYSDIVDLDEDLNHDAGLLILASGEVTKRKGSETLMTLEGHVGKFAMIGNSITDYVGDDIAVHFAVSSSTQAYLDQADYIAQEPVTSGVVEILQRLAVADLPLK